MKIEQLVGWALVHSVWEGAAIAAVLAVTLSVWKRASAGSRYLAALAALLLCLFAPIGTAAWIARVPNGVVPTTTIGSPSKFAVASDVQTATFSTPIPSADLTAPAVSSISNLQEKVERNFPWILRLWLVGLVAMCLRLAGGLFVVERLKRRSSERMAEPWSALSQSVAARLGIKKRIELRLCDGIDTPSVVGAIKATVLFPASALCRLTPGQVEALLAHELAHVRRHDYVVNLIQSVIETVLFYHPAIWWVSKVIREEREHCCDDLAIEAIGSRLDYVKALASLEDCRHATASLAMAGAGGSLVGRIKRILNIRPAKRTGWGAFHPAALSLALAITLGISAGLAHSLTLRDSHAANEEKTIIVRGKALDSDGKPMPGAMAFCRSVNLEIPLVSNLSAITDSNGEFSFSAKSPDRCEILVAKRGYGYSVTRNNQDALTKSVTLRFPVTTSVKVVVLDRKGHPIPGLRLRPWMSPHFREKGLDAFAETTDDRGMAIFRYCPVTSATSFVSEDPRIAVSLAPTKGGNAYLQEEQQRVAVLLGEPSATIRGRVTLNGNPVTHAVAVGYTPTSAFYAEAMTDSDGNFELTGFPSRNAKVRVDLPKPLKIDWVSPAVDTNLSSGTIANVDVKLTHGALISGRVTTKNGSPAKQVPVSVIGLPILAVPITDENGRYEVRLVSGRYTMQAGRSLNSPPSRFYTPKAGSIKSVDVKEGERLQVNLTMPTSGVLTHISVIDASGKPLPNVLVDCGVGYSRSGVMTDEDGQAQVVMDEANSKKAWFRAANRDQFSDPHVTAVDGEARIYLHKVNVGSVSGRVVEADGGPVPHASILVSYSSWETLLADPRELRNTWTSADGTYRIKGLKPGVTLTLMVDDKLHALATSTQVNVVAGKTVSVPPIIMKKGARPQVRS